MKVMDMKLLRKVTISVGIALLFGATTVSARSNTYIVESGDTLLGIAYKLGFNSIEEAELTAPSGDINKIFVSDELEYKTKRKKRFILKQPEVDLDRFCFKDNRSIHYRATERCK